MTKKKTKTSLRRGRALPDLAHRDGVWNAGRRGGRRGAGAAVGAGTGYGAGKGALIGTGVGAAAGAIYDITRH